MKIFVRTIGDRQIDPTYSQINYIALIDTERKPIDSFIKALEIIGEDDALLLEDDLILCQNFLEEVHKAIERFPNKIINFFQRPHHYRPIIESQDIEFNQCTYYPAHTASKIAEVMKTLPRALTGQKKNMYSLLESTALKQLGWTLIQYRPHLVQHKDLDTTLFLYTTHFRRSLYFLDYLTELGITYEEVPKHFGKLVKLYQRQFERIN